MYRTGRAEPELLRNDDGTGLIGTLFGVTAFLLFLPLVPILKRLIPVAAAGAAIAVVFRRLRRKKS